MNSASSAIGIVIELAPADRIQIAKQVDHLGVPGPPQVVRQGKTLVIQGLRRQFREIGLRSSFNGCSHDGTHSETLPGKRSTSRIIASRQNSADPRRSTNRCESASYHAPTARECIADALARDLAGVLAKTPDAVPFRAAEKPRYSFAIDRSHKIGGWSASRTHFLPVRPLHAVPPVWRACAFIRPRARL